MALSATVALCACDRGDEPPVGGGPASSASTSAGAARTADAPTRAVIIALGAEAPSASDGAMRFVPAWTAKVNVASR